jgi:hypothetical protein
MKLMEVISPKFDPKKMVGYYRELLLICKDVLKLNSLPPIKLITDGEHHRKFKSFGSFNGETDEIMVEINGRHPIDAMRTLAHELVHYKQNLDGRIKPDSGETGSDIENEANAIAGVIMRQFDHKFPDAFDIGVITEGTKTSKDNKTDPKVLKSAVTDLENTLLATNKRKHTYKEIDTMMKKICKEKKITGKELHDAFVKKHGVSPDEWIEYQEIG